MGTETVEKIEEQEAYTKFLAMDDDEELTKAHGELVECLWRDTGVQATWGRYPLSQPPSIVECHPLQSNPATHIRTRMAPTRVLCNTLANAIDRQNHHIFKSLNTGMRADSLLNGTSERPSTHHE